MITHDSQTILFGLEMLEISHFGKFISFQIELYSVNTHPQWKYSNTKQTFSPPIHLRSFYSWENISWKANRKHLVLGHLLRFPSFKLEQSNLEKIMTSTQNYESSQVYAFILKVRLWTEQLLSKKKDLVIFLWYWWVQIVAFNATKANYLKSLRKCTERLKLIKDPLSYDQKLSGQVTDWKDCLLFRNISPLRED